tara:strand:- start:2275 stop:2571 length:297 start_codon:yes stop_codon:yes gene_type:complete
MTISPGSEDERMALGRWIKMGRELIVGTFPLGESTLDPNVKREGAIAQRAEEYVKYDHEVGEKLSHLRGKFRYALETYYRDTWGPYLPSDEDLKKYYG